MVNIEDLREGFYLKDERIRSPVIQLCYVCKEGKQWFVYTPGGGSILAQFKQEIGNHMLAVDPLFLEGPIDPKDYLKQHNTNLKKFVDSKLEQLSQSSVHPFGEWAKEPLAFP